MARKSSKPQLEEIEDLVGDEGEADIESTAGTAPGKRMTKAGAARAALAAGVDVPKQASVYIKQRFGIDISPQQFSAEKCRLKQRSGGPEFARYRRISHQPLRSFARVRAGPASSRARRTCSKPLRVMKPLIELLGVDKVKRMVDLLG